MAEKTNKAKIGIIVFGVLRRFRFSGDLIILKQVVLLHQERCKELLTNWI